jgi:hypothetical protein
MGCPLYCRCRFAGWGAFLIALAIGGYDNFQILSGERLLYRYDGTEFFFRLFNLVAGQDAASLWSNFVCLGLFGLGAVLLGLGFGTRPGRELEPPPLKVWVTLGAGSAALLWKGWDRWPGLGQCGPLVHCLAVAIVSGTAASLLFALYVEVVDESSGGGNWKLRGKVKAALTAGNAWKNAAAEWEEKYHAGADEWEGERESLTAKCAQLAAELTAAKSRSALPQEFAILKNPRVKKGIRTALHESKAKAPMGTNEGTRERELLNEMAKRAEVIFDYVERNGTN